MGASWPNRSRPSARQSTKPLPIKASPQLPRRGRQRRTLPQPPRPTREISQGGRVDIFGSFALVLALLAAVYALAGGIAAIGTRKPLLLKSSRNAGMIVFPLVTLAISSLMYLFFSDNFSMAYVAAHSNRDLPAFFKIAALWSGQEGSLLFWSWLLSIYAFFVLYQNRHRHPELMPYVGVVLA